MGVFSSKHWNEMLEVQEMEEKEKDKAGKKMTPLLDKRTKVLRTDPRSASEGVDRTPIAVERQNDLDTPVLLSYSPLLPKLKTLALDPRSPSGLERTPIVVEERPSRNTDKDMLRRVLNASDSPSSSTPVRSSLESSNSLESSLTTSTPVMSPCITGEVGKKCDRGQPRKLLQNQFRDNLEALYGKDEFSSGVAGDQVSGTYTEDKVFQTPPATGGLVSGTCDATNLLSGTPPAAGDLVNGTPPAAGDFVSGTKPSAGDMVSGTKPSAGDMVSGTPPAAGDMVSAAPSAGDLVSGVLPVAGI